MFGAAGFQSGTSWLTPPDEPLGPVDKTLSKDGEKAQKS
jgi:hypothetical protein